MYMYIFDTRAPVRIKNRAQNFSSGKQAVNMHKFRIKHQHDGCNCHSPIYQSHEKPINQVVYANSSHLT